jgi:hypothetical protein
MIWQLKNGGRTMGQSYDAISLTGLRKRSSQGLDASYHLARKAARLWRSLALSTIHCIVLALAMLSANLQLACAQESSDIAKQAQNPIASLISVPLENDFNPHTGVDKKDSYVLEVKPVVPFRLSNDWNLIRRTIVPVIQVPDLAPGVNGTGGLGDVWESLFLSPTKAGEFPTISSNIEALSISSRRATFS